MLSSFESSEQHLTTMVSNNESRMAGANSSKLSKQLHRKLNEFTMHWLEENYECQEGICLPRCLLYKHYIHYMKAHQANVKPIGAAAFGKLVRQKFPKISTRRLGTRGQSKYHYYGIAIRQCSPFYEDQKSVVFSQSSGNFVFKLNQHTPPSTPTNTGLLKQEADDSFAYWNKSDSMPSHAYSVHSDDFHQQLYHYSFHESSRRHNSSFDGVTRNVHSTKTTKRRSKLLLLKSLAMANQTMIDDAGAATGHSSQPSPTVADFEEDGCDSERQLANNLTTLNMTYGGNAAATSSTTYSYFQNNFPTIHDFQLPYGITPTTLSTFLLMYQSHCQRVLDTFQLANVEELEKAVTNFWNKMPSHLAPLLSHHYLTVVIDTVDTLLYRTIEEFLSQLCLMPDMSNSFITDIEHILKEMKQWIGGSILGNQSRMKEIICEYMLNATESDSPDCVNVQTKVGSLLVSLVKCKVDSFEQFSLTVRKQLKFFKMAKNCRSRLTQAKYCSQMIEDLHEICADNSEYILRLQFDRSLFHASCDQPESSVDQSKLETENPPCPHSSNSLIRQVHIQFGSLLMYFQKMIDFEQILRWARTTVEQYVFKGNWSCLITRSQAMLHGFNSYVLMLMRDLTINGAKSLKLWNTIFLCVKEYVLLEVSRAIRYEKQTLTRTLQPKAEPIETTVWSNGCSGSISTNTDYWTTRGFDYRNTAAHLPTFSYPTNSYHQDAGYSLSQYQVSGSYLSQNNLYARLITDQNSTYASASSLIASAPVYISPEQQQASYTSYESLYVQPERCEPLMESLPQVYPSQSSIKWSDLKWPERTDHRANLSYKVNYDYPSSVYQKSCLSNGNVAFTTDQQSNCAVIGDIHSPSTSGAATTNTSQLVTSEEGNVYACLN